MAAVDVAIARQQFELANQKLEWLTTEYLCHLTDSERARVMELNYRLRRANPDALTVLDAMPAAPICEQELVQSLDLPLSESQHSQAFRSDVLDRIRYELWGRPSTRVAPQLGFAAIALMVALGSGFGLANPDAAIGMQEVVAMNVSSH